MDSLLFKARLFDTAELCEKTSRPKYLGFLSREERAFAEQHITPLPVVSLFFGGYENAERVLLGCFPGWVTEPTFPITALTFIFRYENKLSHRDFLGALTALGIKRETIGDILIDDGRAVVFVLNDVADFVKSQITKIGSTGVKITDGFSFPLPEGDKPVDFSVTSASERLDCVISALCGVSRSRASELIAEGLVTVNSVPSEKTTSRIAEGDVISVRKKGRFIISSLGGRTKKDRIIIKYKKYI